MRGNRVPSLAKDLFDRALVAVRQRLPIFVFDLDKVPIALCTRFSQELLLRFGFLAVN